MPANALRQRVITAAIVIAALLPAFLFLPKAFGFILITVFVFGAAWEWGAFLGIPGRAVRLAYMAFVSLLMGAAWLLLPQWLSPVLVAAVSMVWWALALACIVRFPVTFGRAVTLLCGVMVLLPAWVSMVALLDTPVQGRSFLLLVLAIVWAADVGAFFVGRRFGRVKLAPRVSPGKTWEGVIGGLACAGAAAAAGAAVLGHSPAAAIPLGISVAAVSIVGDLTVSMFKRNAGVKDSGNLFPGHGGVLDRVDSLTAAAPLFLLLAGWIGWLGS